jgi:hypothetical protein
LASTIADTGMQALGLAQHPLPVDAWSGSAGVDVAGAVRHPRKGIDVPRGLLLRSRALGRKLHLTHVCGDDRRPSPSVL